MSPIGVFDSGYGGLTILRELVDRLPGYDYLYLGDNARAPYGNRSFDTVYRYTLECVQWLLQQGCPLIILACNTASAKALRTIQQNNLPHLDPEARVLGVIRPTTEAIGNYTTTGHIGILATNGTVQSGSYQLEIEKFYPQIKVVQEACPMWVPLVENGEHLGDGADYFIKKNIDHLLQSDPQLDALLLACTHYPLLKEKILRVTPPHVKLVLQPHIVGERLQDYLLRHEALDKKLSKKRLRQFYTTDSTEEFNEKGSLFFGQPVFSVHADLQGLEPVF
jgi:glutamate racemase